LIKAKAYISQKLSDEDKKKIDRLEVVQWARENGCALDSKCSFGSAATGGRQKRLRLEISTHTYAALNNGLDWK